MKICDKCSVANDDAAVFCTGCGAVLPNDNGQETQENQVNQASAEMNAPQPQPTYAQQGPAYSQMQSPYVQPVGSQPAYSTPPYSQPYGYAPINENMLPEEYKPVTVGQYIGYSILFGLPIIGIIMLFVTAFGSDKSKSLRNFAKANLVMFAIGIVLAIVWIVFAGAIIGEIGYY